MTDLKFHDLALDLGRRAPELARMLLGEPTSSNSRQYRYRGKGSLCILVAGAEAGHFFDHDPPAGSKAHGDAIDLIAHVTGCSLREAYTQGIEFLGGVTRESTLRPGHDGETPRDRIDRALSWWTEGKSAPGTIVERYLQGRGITCKITSDIKFHPELWNSEAQRKLPAMVALMRDIGNDEACGIHRTWLLPDGSGKAKLTTPKKMYGRAKNATIKLAPDWSITEGIGLTEGIETGLSLISIGWAAVWAVGSAGAMARFPILGGVEAITVFADHDNKATGVRAARTCANRWQSAGREATIHYPDACGHDWNDVLRGIAA
ncbi:MAG: toprim domain-containing protein [Alphaproteobacteria bacterium]|nr:toprim domain-containing protein [Alphaproteobacteria bacterium]